MIIIIIRVMTSLSSDRLSLLTNIKALKIEPYMWGNCALDVHKEPLGAFLDFRPVVL